MLILACVRARHGGARPPSPPIKGGQKCNRAMCRKLARDAPIVLGAVDGATQRRSTPSTRGFQQYLSPAPLTPPVTPSAQLSDPSPPACVHSRKPQRALRRGANRIQSPMLAGPWEASANTPPATNTAFPTWYVSPPTAARNASTSSFGLGASWATSRHRVAKNVRLDSQARRGSIPSFSV